MVHATVVIAGHPKPTMTTSPGQSVNRSVSIQRYSDVAIILHWLMAVLFIGLLAVGKYMASLPEDSAETFTLIQWHKTCGVLVLLLAVLRLLWRCTHKPPPETDAMPAWQQGGASAVHFCLYLAMLLIPLSGWVMVSASELGVPTLLFDVIEWPHLSLVENAANSRTISSNAHRAHELLANVAILALLVHVGAAIKHRLVDRDGVMQRMLPGKGTGFGGKLLVLGLLVAAGAALVNVLDARNSTPTTAGAESVVGFVATISGEAVGGNFTESNVDALIDADNAAGSHIRAEVQTGSVISDNAQVAGSLPDADWFDAQEHPLAVFESTAITATSADRMSVEGDLTIKGITQAVSFELLLDEEGAEDRHAHGEFTVDRRDFAVGLSQQPDDSMVAYEVMIRFSFSLEQA